MFAIVICLLCALTIVKLCVVCVDGRSYVCCRCMVFCV